MIDLGINGLFVEAGTYSYTLKQKKKIKDLKTGKLKDGSEAVGYYGNLAGAINAALGECIRDAVAEDRVMTLKEAVAEVRKLHEEFMGILRSAVGENERVGREYDVPRNRSKDRQGADL